MDTMLKTKQCGCAYSYSAVSGLKTLDFELPESLEAAEPPEARGHSRDQVRLLISHYSNDTVRHAGFVELEHHLDAGDVLVVNTSGTMNAALNATRVDGTVIELHLSTRLPADLWSVELRRPAETSTMPLSDGKPGERLELPGGGEAILHTPHNSALRGNEAVPVRLWLATLRLAEPVGDYLSRHGFPIRYSYVKQQWPLSYYQTVYATELGSAEMPSAGRAFTPDSITRLVARGVQIAPLTLHTGVASLEEHEPPYEERYRVPKSTAETINLVRQNGKRVIAVGTTVVRALETVVDDSGVVHPGEGWTTLVVTPARGVKAVDGMLTGFHEPRATHLAMLESVAGLAHLCVTYQEALKHNYLWHEFGDLHLILP